MLKKSYFLLIIFIFFVNINLVFSKQATDSALITYKNIIQKCNIKVMAFYFPQFHEVEENDQFWGKGFTEWTLMNHFKGAIKKPHQDVGYYNMLDYEVRKRQARMAKEHGIDAFCYYHYWFKDKKVMHKGIEKILNDNEPNIPFTFCWANESWTRNWNGLEQDILLEQKYGDEKDWEKHYHYLANFFRHPNYIKEEGCPILYIYRVQTIIKEKKLAMLELWKKMATEDGFGGLKIIAILGGLTPINVTKNLDYYIDGYAEHQPTYGMRLYKSKLAKRHSDLSTSFDTQQFYTLNLRNKKISANYTRGVFYSWDNSSRRINKPSIRFINPSLEIFENFILQTIRLIGRQPNINTNYILLNSWNEWTEQAMVEPNAIDGYAILNVLKRIFR